MSSDFVLFLKVVCVAVSVFGMFLVSRDNHSDVEDKLIVACIIISLGGAILL